MKALLSAALIALSAASIAEPDEQGKTFYTSNTPSTNTVKRFATDTKDWLNHNLMTSKKAAKSAPPRSQVGSFSVRSNAEAHEDRIKNQNPRASVWIETALVSRKNVYRVIINRPCNSVANSKPETGCAKVAK